MIIKVQNSDVRFDCLPPIHYIRKGETYLYKLETPSNDVLLRKVTGSNVIVDLCQAIELLGEAPIYYFSTQLTAAEKALANNMRVCDNENKNRKALLRYNTATKALACIHPSFEACATAIGVTVSSIKSCCAGYLSILPTGDLVSTKYLTKEDIEGRIVKHRRVTDKSDRNRPVYVYDALGDLEAVYRNSTEAARALGVHFTTITKGLMYKNKCVHGYYFYDNPNDNPNIKLDKTL